MIRLDGYGWRVVIDPAIGGSLSHLSYQGLPVFRDRDRHAADFVPLQMSCFPLVPFSNRIADGRFTFGDHIVLLSPNLPGEAHAIHGSGWNCDWQVADHSDRSCLLQLWHEKGEWPWSFRACQEIALGPAGLSMTLRLTNESHEIMPAGLGFHPYFHRTSDCELSFSAQKVWVGEEPGIPVDVQPTPVVWNFADLRPINGVQVDNCFSDWDGNARIFWPASGLEVEMSCSREARHAVFYAPEGENFFCLEPVTHVSNAMNSASPPDRGVLLLEPGETRSIVMNLRAARLS